MGTQRPRLTHTTFHCLDCDFLFEGDPARVEDEPATPWHPWAYFRPCPVCGVEAPQHERQRTLLKMWAKATGPKTAAGKAASAKNLEGHPTPDEALRTRFNAMKHGLSAEVASYFPAKPGKYPQCASCEYLHSTCTPRQVACMKRTELFMRHRIAFETRDPGLLTDLRADLHANLQAIVEDMLRTVLVQGATFTTPEWYYDREGTFHLAKYTDEATGEERQIFKIEEHPLLKRIGEFVSRLGLDLNSQAMTPKVQDDEDAIRGHLAGAEQNATLALEYQRQQAEALSNMRDIIRAARQEAAQDPVLLEHQRASDAE